MSFLSLVVFQLEGRPPGYAYGSMITVQVCPHANYEIWHNQTADELRWSLGHNFRGQGLEKNFEDRPFRGQGPMTQFFLIMVGKFSVIFKRESL